MVKLAGLIEGMTSALQVPGSRVRTAAAELRKHKLLKTGPRGPGAPEMGPEDAAALLLALMYDDDLSAAAVNVDRLATAPLVSSICQKGGERFAGQAPPHSFLREPDGGQSNLGDLIMTLLDWWVRYGTIQEEAEEGGGDCSAYNLRLSLVSPGHRATLHFNSHEAFWNLSYQWRSPEQVAYEADRPPSGIDFRPRWDAMNGPYMSSSRTVEEDCLAKIADCLRGHAWRDQDEEIAPPYDRCCAAEEADL